MCLARVVRTACKSHPPPLCPRHSLPVVKKSLWANLLPVSLSRFIVPLLRVSSRSPQPPTSFPRHLSSQARQIGVVSSKGRSRAFLYCSHQTLRTRRDRCFMYQVRHSIHSVHIVIRNLIFNDCRFSAKDASQREHHSVLAAHSVCNKEPTCFSRIKRTITTQITQPFPDVASFFNKPNKEKNERILRERASAAARPGRATLLARSAGTAPKKDADEREFSPSRCADNTRRHRNYL